MIGSGVVRYLNDIGYRNLLLVDDLKEGDKWKNLLGKQFVDLISRHKILDWLQGKEQIIDAIIHLGACSDTTETNADYLLENNFRFSVCLATWALRANKRFIYASSAATYGDGARGFSDDEAGLQELRPLNMYGFSKHLFDLWLQREGVLNKVVGLKYFNVFGPNENHKGRMASFLAKVTQKAHSGETIGLFKSNDPARFADGDQCRDFIYLKDAVRMTCGFLQDRQKNGIYNIGLGAPTTWNQMSQYLFQALQKPSKITYVEMPAHLNLQYQNYTCADMRKFRRDFAVESTQMPQAVAEYVTDYLLKNERW